MSQSTNEAEPELVPWDAVRIDGGGDGLYELETRVQVSLLMGDLELAPRRQATHNVAIFRSWSYRNL
jgi:hypothetical protein